MSTSERAGRVGWLAFPVAILLGIQSAPADDHSADAALFEKARQIHTRILAFDSHVDIPLNYGDPGLEASSDGRTQIDLPKMERGLLKGDAATHLESRR